MVRTYRSRHVEKHRPSLGINGENGRVVEQVEYGSLGITVRGWWFCGVHHLVPS